MALVTISIVSYNGIGKIEDCLRSLHAQTFTDYRIIVVDNASSDGTIAAVTNISPEAKIVALHENVGFGAGHNLAIAESTSDYVLVLNQDVVMHPEALQHLVHAAQTSQAACVGPLLLRPGTEQSTRIVDTAGLLKRPWWSVQDRGTGKPLTMPLRRPGFIWGISGACMLLNRKALQNIAFTRRGATTTEYFDASFFMYKEDIDLIVRLHNKGYRCWYAADATGSHGRTGQSGNRARLPAYVREYSYRNHWFLLVKHVWALQLIFVLPYELLKFLYILVREPKTLRVLPDIFKHLPSLLKRRYA